MGFPKRKWKLLYVYQAICWFDIRTEKSCKSSLVILIPLSCFFLAPHYSFHLYGGAFCFSCSKLQSYLIIYCAYLNVTYYLQVETCKSFSPSKYLAQSWPSNKVIPLLPKDIPLFIPDVSQTNIFAAIIWTSKHYLTPALRLWPFNGSSHTTQQQNRCSESPHHPLPQLCRPNNGLQSPLHFCGLRPWCSNLSPHSHRCIP